MMLVIIGGNLTNGHLKKCWTSCYWPMAIKLFTIQTQAWNCYTANTRLS